MVLYPNAKINLGLNVVAKRPDGYHDIETVFYPTYLQDVLEIEARPNENKEYTLSVTGYSKESIAPDDNLVVKAYRLLKKDFCQMSPVDIRLHKHIPIGAGLGGGSADAAYTIKLLNEVFSMKLNAKQMEVYAAKLGADCAFFIQNKPVFATGIGNVFEPIDLSLKGCFLVIVTPDISISTAEAYSHIVPRHPDVSIKEIIRQPVETWKGRLKNDFEDIVFSQYPEIATLKEQLYDMGAVYASMSGSGSTVYGIYNRQVKDVEEEFRGYFCRQVEMK